MENKIKNRKNRNNWNAKRTKGTFKAMAQKKQNYSISSGRIQPGYMHQSDMYPTSPAKEI